MSDTSKNLKEKLFYTKKNGLLKAEENVLEKATSYCEGYKRFLDIAKTEREAVKTAVAMVIPALGPSLGTAPSGK